MKKASLYTFVFLLIASVATAAYGQTTATPTYVDYPGPAPATTSTTNPFNIFGTAGSGTVSTSAVNTTKPTDPIVATPQANSPELASCSAITFESLLDILIWVKCIIVIAIIPLIFSLAFVFFLWGVFRFIMADDSTKKDEGKKFITGGLIGLFVMTSLWGIVNIVSTTLGTGSSSVPLLQTSYLKK